MLMTETDMVKLPGLFLRGSAYYLRTVVPLDVRGGYSGKPCLTRALRTSDLRTAVLRGTKLRAEQLEDFELKRRQLNPQVLQGVTPETSAELAHRVRARLLRQDEESRDSPDVHDALAELHAHMNPASPLTIKATIEDSQAPSPMQDLGGLSGSAASGGGGVRALGSVLSRRAAYPKDLCPQQIA